MTESFGPKETALIEAYLRVAQKEGVHNVTLQKVAKESKVPYSSVHYYFGGKETDLLSTALQFVAVSLEAYLNQQVTAQLDKKDKNSLELYTRAKFDWVKKYPAHASMWLYFVHMSTRDSVFEKINQQVYVDSHAKMKTYLLLEHGKGNVGAVRDMDGLVKKIQIAQLGGILIAMSTQDNGEEIQRRTVDIIRQQIKDHEK